MEKNLLPVILLPIAAEPLYLFIQIFQIQICDILAPPIAAPKTGKETGSRAWRKESEGWRIALPEAVQRRREQCCQTACRNSAGMLCSLKKTESFFPFIIHPANASHFFPHPGYARSSDWKGLCRVCAGAQETLLAVLGQFLEKGVEDEMKCPCQGQFLGLPPGQFQTLRVKHPCDLPFQIGDGGQDGGGNYPPAVQCGPV